AIPGNFEDRSVPAPDLISKTDGQTSKFRRAVKKAVFAFDERAVWPRAICKVRAFEVIKCPIIAPILVHTKHGARNPPSTRAAIVGGSIEPSVTRLQQACSWIPANGRRSGKIVENLETGAIVTNLIDRAAERGPTEFGRAIQTAVIPHDQFSSRLSSTGVLIELPQDSI